MSPESPRIAKGKTLPDHAGPFSPTEYFQIRYDDSAMEVPAAPSTLPFRQWGLVPSVCVVLGVPATLLGIVQEVSFTNRRLMLGGTLLLFGFMWHYARRARMRRQVLEAAKCLFFLCLTAVAVYCLIFGKIPALIGQGLGR
jgi:hypothetical protein